eukprot:Gregarina_sp_Poly_1__9813@NODE_628_length_7065_cov_56_119891_g481_i0_p3_GENE_NODE_628_length_7065_cov_56_119891_g481_i0NODE_628_length_7065_cov_56_119891_g481_i0_p3_ORF_typecomplete_len379_score41_54START/PF01852_19/3_5e12_NODE_628_length_7065_cov_56_119891_g481_i044065542
MISRYGLPRVLGDVELRFIVARYDFISSFYTTLSNQRLMGDIEADRMKSTFLPEMKRDSYFFPVDNAKRLPLIKNVITQADWNELCDFVKRNNRLHYMREFSNDFDHVPICQVLSIPDFLFAGFKVSPGAPTKAVIRIDCYLDCPLAAMLSVMAETDMTKTWVPYFRFPMHVGLEACETIAQFGRMDKVTVYKIALPWPLSNEEVILHGWIVDDLTANDRLVICFRGMDDDYPVTASLGTMATPQLQDKVVRIYVEGGCRIRVQGVRRVRLEMMWNIDLKMSIPSSLVKFVAKTFVKTGINSLRNVCIAADTDPAWDERRKANPWLYKFIAQRASAILDAFSAQEKAASLSVQVPAGDTTIETRRKRDIFLFRRSKVN